uniref:Uncharacterized protein n=1 Tax=Lepeophtheirus salmonis TaxID=72036 RepID=A0A0K2TDA0_LEPSM
MLPKMRSILPIKESPDADVILYKA